MKNNLTTLSILHYVYGGFICFIGATMLAVLLIMGDLFQSDWFLDRADRATPPALGALFTGLGWAIFLFLEAKGIANIISGSLLARARGRLFSQLVAGVDCLNIPFGITLGIFTFVELGKPHVQQAYDLQHGAR